MKKNGIREEKGTISLSRRDGGQGGGRVKWTMQGGILNM